MKKNIIFILIFTIVIAATPLLAQTSVVEMETSYVTGYDLAANDIAQTFRVGVNFNLSNVLDAGFIFQQAGTLYAAGSFLVLKYTLAEKIGIGIIFGSTGGNTASGLNVSYDLFQKKNAGLISTLRIKMEYLIPDVTGAIEDGIFGINLGLGFGL